LMSVAESSTSVSVGRLAGVVVVSVISSGTS
jgi:hypothetical protein